MGGAWARRDKAWLYVPALSIPIFHKLRQVTVPLQLDWFAKMSMDSLSLNIYILGICPHTIFAFGCVSYFG